MRTLLVGAQAGLLRHIHAQILADRDFRRLAGLTDRQLPPFIVMSSDIRGWISATFVGHEHRLGVRLTTGRPLPAAARARLTDLVDPAAIDLPRHIVVDVAVATEPGDALVVTATTLDD